MTASSPASDISAGNSSWRGDMLRALAIFALAALLGFSINALRRKPVPVVSNRGPGAVPEKSDRATVEQLKQWLSGGSTVLLDVRKEDVFRSAHPLGAVNLPADDFMRYYGSVAALLAAAERVVLLCESDQCPLADRVAARLKSLEHRAVWVLDGGWQKYQQSGLPVAREVRP
jgi:rhodanese-related sulfurtransferase